MLIFWFMQTKSGITRIKWMYLGTKAVVWLFFFNVHRQVLVCDLMCIICERTEYYGVNMLFVLIAVVDLISVWRDSLWILIVCSDPG